MVAAPSTTSARSFCAGRVSTSVVVGVRCMAFLSFRVLATGARAAARGTAGASLVDDVDRVLLGAVPERTRLPHVLVDQLGLVVGRSKIAGQLGCVGLRRAGSGRGGVVGALPREPSVERLAGPLLCGRSAEVDRGARGVVRRWQALLRIARDHLLVERTLEV